MAAPAFTAAAVRDAERPLLESGQGEGLMRAAAAGLASVCRAILLHGPEAEVPGVTVYPAHSVEPAGTARSRGRVSGARVAVLAGPGNNGGDALFAAADLASRGAHVTILAPLADLHPAGERAALRAGALLETMAREASPRSLRAADLVIDGLLGTGARLPLRSELAVLLDDWQAHAHSDQHVVAVDMPTGTDASTGRCDPSCVRATATVTFGGLKAGQFLPGGAEASGRVHLVDIGLEFAGTPAVYALDDTDLCSWPLPGAADHKYTRGVLGVIAGSARYPGAGVLTATAAVAAGVGMLRVQGAAQVQEAVVAAVPEAVTAPGRVQAWVMGPGAPEAAHTMEFLMEAVGAGIPLVLDAGALPIIPALLRASGGAPPLPAGTVLTPHAGELETLLSALLPEPEEDVNAAEGGTHAGDEEGSPACSEVGSPGGAGTGTRTEPPTRAQIEQAPAVWARRAAELTGAVVLLKGHRTFVAVPEGTVWAPAPGPALLATAGSGDVLAGLVGTAVATGLGGGDGEDRQARAAHLAALAVLLQGRVGREATHASEQVRRIAAHVAALARD